MSRWDDLWSGIDDGGSPGSGCVWFVLLLIAGIVIAVLGANDMLPW